MTSLEMESQDDDEEMAGSLTSLGAESVPHLPHSNQIENEVVSHLAWNGGERTQLQNINHTSAPNVHKAPYSFAAQNTPESSRRGSALSSAHRRQLENEVASRYSMAAKLEPHLQEVHLLNAYHALGLDPTKLRVTTSGKLELQQNRTYINKEVVSTPAPGVRVVPSSAGITIASTSGTSYSVPIQNPLITTSAGLNLESPQPVRLWKVKNPSLGKGRSKTAPVGLEPLIRDDGSMDLINLFLCRECGERFTTEMKLKEHHIENHVDSSEWPYKCNVCQKSFPNKRQLDRHADSIRCTADETKPKIAHGGYIKENTIKANEHLHHVFGSARYERHWML